MRSLTSLVFLLVCSFGFSQRVSFNDPDLTFSFKKPKGWEVFDDGYSVKTSPSAADSSSLFFSITYFEGAQPFGELTIGLTSADAMTDATNKSFKIAGENAKSRTIKKGSGVAIDYTFSKMGQRFEITTLSPLGDTKSERFLKKIVKSIQVTK